MILSTDPPCAPFHRSKLWKIAPRRYITLAPLTYFSYIQGRRTKIVVPKDFETDQGSVPRLFWPLLSPDDYPDAFVIHDWLYTTRQFSRKTCDDMLFELLVSSGCSKHRALMIFYIVQAFGWWRWKKKGN
jgi:hypothetical protein